MGHQRSPRTNIVHRLRPASPIHRWDRGTMPLRPFDLSAGEVLGPAYGLIYWSVSRLAGDARAQAEQLHGLVAQARHANARHGITGALAFGNGRFAQILEGSRASVEVLMARIQADRRHAEIVILQEGWLDRRGFGQWSMIQARFGNEGGPAGVHFLPESPTGLLGAPLSRGATALVEMLHYITMPDRLPH